MPENSISLKKLISHLDVREVPPNVKKKIEPIVQDQIPESLKFIHGSIRKMEALIAAMLRLSRTGRSVLRIENIDMNRLMARIMNDFEYTLKERGIKTDTAMLPACQGDRKLISQVFSNLIDNAIKYRDRSRPGIIRVSGVRQGHFSVYCVEDNGTGIARDYQEKIYDLFSRLDPEMANGEGIGLTVVHKILERHNGSVRVESEPGKGSRFYVAIPS